MQVQHYNLVSQSQSFSAIASLSLGDACSCRHTTTKCMAMFAFDSQNPMHSYSSEDDAVQTEFAAALDRVFGRVDIAAPAKTPSQISALAGSAAAAAIAAGPSTSASASAPVPPFDVSTGMSANLHHVSGGSAAPGTAGVSPSSTLAAASGASPVDSRRGVPSGAAQDLASGSAGPSTSTTAEQSVWGRGNTGSTPATENSSGADTAGAQTGGMALEYEAVTPESLADQSTEDLMLRLTCQTMVRGQRHQQLVESLQMRALALHMQVCRLLLCIALCFVVQHCLQVCRALVFWCSIQYL